MSEQNTSLSLPLPGRVQDFMATLMQALKAGRLYSTHHSLFTQNVKRLHEQFHEAREEGDFFFVGFAKDSILVENDFFQVNDAHGRELLKLFHSLGVSHLMIRKDVSIQELESFVEILAGAKPGQGQEVLTALHREDIRHIEVGILDYSVFSGVESAVAHLTEGRDKATIWRELILRPSTVRTSHLTPEHIEEILRLSGDLESLKKNLADLDRDLKNQVQGISPSQRGQVIGNFLQNISKALGGIDTEKRDRFTENVILLLASIRPDVRIRILGSAPPDKTDEKDGGVIQDVILEMAEEDLVYLLVDALGELGAQSPFFINLFRRALARFKGTGHLLDLVRAEMNRATQERRRGSLNVWQHLEQLLVHHQESEDFNAQYRKAIEDLATSLKIQKPMVEEEEIARLVRSLAPDSLKLFKARLILDILQETQRSDPMTLGLLQSMGETVQHFFNQGRPRLTGNVLRQVFLTLGQLAQKNILTEEVNAWLRVEDVHSLLKSLFEKCHSCEPREMSAISSICQLYPEKAGGFLIDRFLQIEHTEGPLGEWLVTTLASIAPHLTKVLGSRVSAAPDAALPRLVDLADLFGDPQTAPVLEGLLDHKDHEIRSQVIRTLGHLKSPTSVEPLAQIVLGKSWFTGKKTKSIQLQALQALDEIHTAEAMEVLRQIASTGSGELQQWSREILGES